MSLKKASELSDAEVRQVLATLVGHVQELEMHVAEAALLVLYGLDEVEEPGAGAYAETVAQLERFLVRVTAQLKAINDAVEQETRKN